MQETNPLEKEVITSSVQYLKGVGPRRAKLLKNLRIEKIKDLLTHFPRAWEDRSHIVPIAQAQIGEKVLIHGRIELFDILSTKKRLKIFKAAIADYTGLIYLLWFKKDNPRFDVFSKLKKDIQPHKEIFVYGTVTGSSLGTHKELNVETYKVLNKATDVTVSQLSLRASAKQSHEALSDEKEIATSRWTSGLAMTENAGCDTASDDSLHLGRIVPLYSLTEGIEEEFFRKLVKITLDNYLLKVKDILPKTLRNRYQLISYSDALRAIHFPKNFIEKEKAYHRLVFEEFLLFQLAIAIKRQKVKETYKSHTYTIKRHLLTPFRKNLGFDFTDAQKKVINEIFVDLQTNQPMNRLLQGDVGSGKTVVALSAILLATENNYQSAFLAPTEILAEQHYLTFKYFLKNLPVKFALLTSKTSKKERKNILERLKTGEISILIGTHALLEKKVIFKNLKLIVIDEQHRFGVVQRAEIREKGENPDVLVLTATPIPRSLALTLYGDLDVSLLNELPPGRKKIETLHLSDTEAYDFVKSAVADGHQAYIVYPLIEESDKLELKAATTEAEQLKKSIFSNYRVGLIHGQLPGKEKEKIMSAFRGKRGDYLYDILIATTVIEVGIDIPNATVMVVEHADRFGLSTLHQLRGRVGRGGEKSTCILIGETKTKKATGNHLTGNHPKRRIKIMLSTTDGFRIAEEDLKLRGPGEFFGTAQHGFPEYKIGDPIKDLPLLKQTHELAISFVGKDFYTEETKLLRNTLYQKYGQNMELLTIG